MIVLATVRIRWSTCPLVVALVHLFIPFVFHNSGTRPPPFFSLLLTTMPHGRRSVTTSLDCVGTPAVAVLCESDWPSSACVVQLERKKKKRVSVIVGNRKVLKKASNHHQLPSNHHKAPSNHHKVPANEPSNDHRSPNKSASNDQEPPSNDQQPVTDQKSASNDKQPSSNDQQPPSNHHHPFNDQQPPSNDHEPSNDHQLASNDKRPSSNDQEPPSNDHHLFNDCLFDRVTERSISSPWFFAQPPTVSHTCRILGSNDVAVHGWLDHLFAQVWAAFVWAAILGPSRLSTAR
jgi:hypothetical protein